MGESYDFVCNINVDIPILLCRGHYRVFCYITLVSKWLSLCHSLYKFLLSQYFLLRWVVVNKNSKFANGLNQSIIPNIITTGCKGFCSLLWKKVYYFIGVNGNADLCTIILNFPSFPFLKTHVLSTITSFPSLPVTQTLPIVIATEP